VHPDLRSSSTTLPYLHLAADKPRGPGFAAAAVDASLRLKHNAAIALGQASCQRTCEGRPVIAGPLAFLASLSAHRKKGNSCFAKLPSASLCQTFALMITQT